MAIEVQQLINEYVSKTIDQQRAALEVVLRESLSHHCGVSEVRTMDWENGKSETRIFIDPLVPYLSLYTFEGEASYDAFVERREA